MASAEGDRPVLLLVEDSAPLRKVLVEHLQPDHTVLTAGDGLEALELMAALTPDLVLTDLLMPNMTGQELVRAMREQPALAEVPIVVLTAIPDEDLRLDLLGGVVQDYLLKPVSMRELRARVRNLVTIKRARDVLQRALADERGDLDQLARELARRKHELDDACTALEVARDAAEASCRAKSAFLSTVSHELRTPLGLMRLSVDQLSRDPAPEVRRGALVRLDRAARRLSQVVESMLDYASHESELSVHLETVPVRAVFEEVVRELLPAARANGLALELRAPEPEELDLVTDVRLLRLIASNLVDNAIKFTPAGHVEVAAERGAGGGLRLAVTDTGPGIAPTEQARLFAPFEHAEATPHKHTPGLGLGLTLVHELVLALRGTISVRSAVGQGSTFTVTLPPLDASVARAQAVRARA